MDKRPIGVFDSGVGGLTVVKALIKTLPNEDIVYLGDTARVPYGSKSQETVTRFALECMSFLKKFNIKIGIVACNTASSWAIEALKKNFKHPIIGVIEPGVKQALSISQTKRIGVLATRSTVLSGSYKKEILKREKKAKVLHKPCPLFVPLVEENLCNNKIAQEAIHMYLSVMKTKKIDSIILGCTHYPLLKNNIAKYLKNINIIDSSISVSQEVKEFLKINNISNDPKRKGTLNCFVTDEPEPFKKIAKIFLRKEIKVKKACL